MAIKEVSARGSFTDMFTAARQAKVKNEFLDRVDILINWDPIREAINSKLGISEKTKGEAAYDGLLLFKVLLLETWYNLSDRAVEERINDSISFSKFIGIDLEQTSPDHSTICRFRNSLVKHSLFDKLLEMINAQLNQHGIMRIEEGALVDASIVDSPYAPDGSCNITIADDREDSRTDGEKAEEAQYHVQVASAKPGVDNEARWVKKGKTFRYGYKKHALTNTEGLVIALTTTPANTADTREFEHVVTKARLPKETVVYADKGYTSKKNSAFLEQNGYQDGIMKKAGRGKPLNEEDKARNKKISKIRSRVEMLFGGIKRWFLGGRCRYRGKDKVHGQNMMECIAYNLKLAPNLIIKQSLTATVS